MIGERWQDIETSECRGRESENQWMSLRREKSSERAGNTEAGRDRARQEEGNYDR